MPELPEVETVRSGIQVIQGQKFINIDVRQPQLRWPIPLKITKTLVGASVKSVKRRAKYLLIHTDAGTLIIHLGMSGCLRLYHRLPCPEKHDHVDFILTHYAMRYTDPRRFGAILFTQQDTVLHPLLKQLGPEPLSDQFSAEYFFKQSRHRKTAIKNFIMNSTIVVGIGNIYANEALFHAKIHPEKSTKKLTRSQAEALVTSIKKILNKAIKAGGTTLKDFQNSSGKPGYFTQKLLVYGAENKPCVICKTLLKKIVIGQRTSIYCPSCQK